MSTSTARRWALRGTATAVAVIVAAGTIAAAHTIGTTEDPGHPAGRTVIPVPAAAERVCAGSALRLSDDAGNDATRASTIGSPQIATATTGDRVDRSEARQREHRQQRTDPPHRTGGEDRAAGGGQQLPERVRRRRRRRGRSLL